MEAQRVGDVVGLVTPWHACQAQEDHAGGGQMLMHYQLPEIRVFGQHDCAQALGLRENLAIRRACRDIRGQGEGMPVTAQALDDGPTNTLIDEQIHEATGVLMASAA